MFSRDVLKGKRILVTGGGTGLGKEISLGFAAHGAHVFICGRRLEILTQAADEIRGLWHWIELRLGLAVVIGADEIVSDISIASLGVVQTPAELANFL